jgi:putative two-component system response regulator
MIKGPPKILIVDDDPVSGVILTAYLSQDRYDIQFLSIPENVLETAVLFQPDLILLDIMMPGMSGFEVCKQLKSERDTQSIPVLFITAFSDEASRERAIEVGGEGFLTKPCDQELVRGHVKIFLEMSRAGREAGAAPKRSSGLAVMVIGEMNDG